MVFNKGMKTDKELIEALGGAAKVVELLGWKGRPGQVQRVHNWRSRGIPAKVRLDYPDVFPLPKKIKETADV